MTLVPVLMYHALGTPKDARFSPWVISPSLLADHLALLRESGYEFAGLTDWARGQRAQNCVVLTFDDGYADFLDHALPVLASHGARATVYVVTAYVGGQARWLPFATERTRPMLGWDDLRAIQDSGIEVGSHGHQHIELDVVQPAIAESDVRRSRDALTEQGFSPRSFCYPFGYANRRVRDMVARAGFTNACVVGRGLANSEKDMFQVRRLPVDHRTTPEVLLRRCGGPEVPAAARLRECAQPAWRLTRRLRSAVCGLVSTGGRG
jgi:peptidoglycan/xylan/chitin deacetylase (PgdA/CDA1 family)